MEDSVLNWIELFYCDGATEEVIADTICKVPIAGLLEGPYSLVSGDTFAIRVIAVTDQGESILAEEKEIVMPLEPDPPLLLAKDEITSFVGKDDTFTLSIKWNAPVSDGGS